MTSFGRTQRKNAATALQRLQMSGLEGGEARGASELEARARADDETITLHARQRTELEKAKDVARDAKADKDATKELLRRLLPIATAAQCARLAVGALFERWRDKNRYVRRARLSLALLLTSENSPRLSSCARRERWSCASRSSRSSSSGSTSSCGGRPMWS